MNNPFSSFDGVNPNGIVKSPKGARFSRNGNRFFLSYQGNVTELKTPAKAFLGEYYKEAWFPTLKNETITFATPSETWIKTTAGNTDTGWTKSRGGSPFVRVLSETNPVLGDILSVYAGEYFTYFLKTNGDLYSAGENYDAQLGLGFSSERETASLALSDVKKAFNGVYSSFGFAVKNDNTLWGTGYGSNGQWGNGTSDSYDTWTEITLDGDITGSGHVVDVACGEYFAAFLMSDNTLWGAGDDMGIGISTPIQIDTNVTAMAAGGYHLLYIKDDATLWGVGDNGDGQLGTGDYGYHNYDDPVQIDTGVKAIGCGGYHSGYIKTDDTLWMTGANWDGQLGDGSDTSRTTPIQMSTNVKSVVGGDSHTLFIKNDNTLWGVGITNSGELGLFTDNATFEPVQIDTNVSSVSTGYEHTLYIKSDKTLYGMGYNYYFSLGKSFYEAAMYSTNATSGWTAVSHEYINPSDTEGIDVSWNDLVYAEGKFVAGGGEGVTVIKYSTDGVVWQTASIENTTYGINGLAYGGGTFVAINNPDVGQPEIYTSEDGITWNTSSIRGYTGDLYGVTYGNGLFIAGGNDRIIRSTDGTNWLECTRSLYSATTYRFAYGNNTYVAAASAGNAEDTNEYGITFNGGTASFISAADDSAFLISDGVLYACGDPVDGKLGMGDINRVVYFYPITSNVKTVAASNRHTTFVKNDGSLWGMGRNNYGQLGDGTYMRRFHPVQIDTNVSQSYGGDEFDSTIYIKNDNTLWGLGANNFSQIADSTVYGNSLTSSVQIDSNVKMAAGGDNYIIYLKNDGTLWGRGYNDYGQLGLGDTNSRTSSVQIDSGVSYCVASNLSSYYIKTNGSLYGMGYNGYGQLGLDDTSDRNTPVQITSSGVIQVAAGTEYSKYIDSTGRIYGAGNNQDGALGTGNNSTQYTHTLATVSGSVQIACAFQTSYMIKSDGTVFSCGNNGDGLLGTNYVAEDAGTYSTDGVTWSSSLAPDFFYRDVAFGNGRFVMVADDPFAISSTNGINWTASYVTTSSYVELSKITFDGTKFVAVAYDTDNTFYNVFTSTDGISWTQDRIGPDSDWSAVAYGDGKYVVLASGIRHEVRPATALTI